MIFLNQFILLFCPLNLSSHGENTALEHNLHHWGVGRRRRRVSTGRRVPRAVTDKPVYVLEIARVGFSPRRSFFARASTCCFFKATRPSFFYLFCESPGRKRGRPVDWTCPRFNVNIHILRQLGVVYTVSRVRGISGGSIWFPKVETSISSFNWTSYLSRKQQETSILNAESIVFRGSDKRSCELFENQEKLNFFRSLIFSNIWTNKTAIRRSNVKSALPHIYDNIFGINAIKAVDCDSRRALFMPNTRTAG